ncbi:hypothetical protein [Rhizobium leguminosarum]|uniref:hypothetical protein n=1 Tax=Rhizobium leguminosarum TaxID=384 RepID=UPI001C95A9CF|nr:hypothetical protein [Rhizobium leguminosarum]MBY5329597.1 hypothetical protein [Rhizobium leguminosarum]
MAAKRWVRWDWSDELGEPVRTVLKPTELKAKGIHNPAAGFVKEGSKEEFFQKELCGQRDIFELLDAA